MFQFIFGFVTGYLFNFCRNIYLNYKQYNSIKKLAINKIYTYFVDKIFNLFYEDISNNLNNINIQGIQNINDIQILIDSFDNVIKNHKNKFKLTFSDENCKIKLLDSEYINNPDFMRVCQFFTDNHINIHIILNNSNNLKLE
jgi:hypothetical protein